MELWEARRGSGRPSSAVSMSVFPLLPKEPGRMHGEITRGRRGGSDLCSAATPPPPGGAGGPHGPAPGILVAAAPPASGPQVSGITATESGDQTPARGGVSGSGTGPSSNRDRAAAPDWGSGGAGMLCLALPAEGAQ